MKAMPICSGIEAVHALQVQRAHEEKCQHAGDQKKLDEVRAPNVAGPKDVQRKQWVLRGGLARHKSCEQQQRKRSESDGAEGAPAVRAGSHDGVDPEHQRTGDKNCTDCVGASTEAQAAVGIEQPPRKQHRNHSDRNVDQEDPVPADGLREDATGKEADRGARRGDKTVNAKRAGPLSRLREHRHDHPEGDCGAQSATNSLDEARSDKHLGAG